MKLTEKEYEQLIAMVSYGGVNMRRFYKDQDKFDERYNNIKAFVISLSKKIDKPSKV